MMILNILLSVMDSPKASLQCICQIELLHVYPLMIGGQLFLVWWLCWKNNAKPILNCQTAQHKWVKLVYRGEMRDVPRYRCHRNYFFGWNACRNQSPACSHAALIHKIPLQHKYTLNEALPDCLPPQCGHPVTDTNNTCLLRGMQLQQMYRKGASFPDRKNYNQERWLQWQVCNVRVNLKVSLMINEKSLMWLS